MLLPTSKVSTVSKILSAAEGLFVVGAYSDVTIDQVAAVASVTKGAVYHHFSSKEHLYLTMLQHDLAGKQAMHQRAIAFDGSCEERLRRLTEDFLKLPETKRKLISLVRRDIDIFETDTRNTLIDAYQQALPDIVEEVIRDGIRNREIMNCDPRLLAWQFVSLVEVVLTPYAQQQLKSDQNKVNHVMGLFFGGCARTGPEKNK
jgi:AcrR family transcriptional regulator